MSVSRCRTTLFPAVELGGQVRNVFRLKKTWVSLLTQVRPVICRSRAIVLVVIAFKLNKPHKSACFFLLVPQNKDTFVNPVPLLTLPLNAQPQTSRASVLLCVSASLCPSLRHHAIHVRETDEQFTEKALSLTVFSLFYELLYLLFCIWFLLE